MPTPQLLVGSPTGGVAGTAVLGVAPAAGAGTEGGTGVPGTAAAGELTAVGPGGAAAGGEAAVPVFPGGAEEVIGLA